MRADKAVRVAPGRRNLSTFNVYGGEPQTISRVESQMDSEDSEVDTCKLRPVIGLTDGLATSDLERLTVNAIRLHRQLLEKADQLFQALPEDYRAGKANGGVQHLEYIEAMIEMHAQMSAVNTLLGVLGYIPKMAAN